MLNTAHTWSCRDCVSKGLQKRRNCGGVFRAPRTLDEGSTPFDVVFSGFDTLASMQFRDVWLDRCPLNFSFANTGGISSEMIELFGLAGRYRNQGVLPYAGGVLDQPSKLMGSLDVIIREQDKIEGAKRSIANARSETEKAFRESKRYG